MNETLKCLALFEKARLLSDEKYQTIWGPCVPGWKAELAKYVRAGGTAVPGVGDELYQVRPCDAVLGAAILAAELDYPKPLRPSERSTSEEGISYLKLAKTLLETQAALAHASDLETDLRVARAHLYLRDYAGASSRVVKYRKAKPHNEIAAYIEAECVFADEKLSETQRAVQAAQLIQPFPASSYPPLLSLRNAIAAS